MRIERLLLERFGHFEDFELDFGTTSRLHVVFGPNEAGKSTLLAAIGDVAHPAWRGRAVGIYRLWRDGGFAVGALTAGLVADAWGIDAAVWTVAVLTALSGGLVAVRMYETHVA